MDLEFERATRRFANDQSSRNKQAAERRAKLRAEQERTRAHREKWERELAAREEKARRAAAEAERLREEDLERNRGIVFHARLRPVLSLEGEARRIHRRADKVTLPRSAAVELASASKNGQLFFELSAPGRPPTHASILDFSAEEGTIGAPPEVLRCLGLPADGSRTAEVAVRYKVLKKGTFAKVQPVAAQFRAEVEDVKLLLERELQLRTTLSEGDEVLVVDEGRSYALRILQLQPESAVSLIDTDLEAELLPSVEEEEAAARQEAGRLARLEREAKTASQAAEAAQAAEEAARRAAAEAQAVAEAALHARNARRVAALAALQPEPAAGADGVVNVVLRCPDGSRCAGRFLLGAPLSALFTLVEAKWVEKEGAALLPSDFRLASTYPRRTFDRSQAAEMTLEAAGLDSTQEALFVEIPATGDGESMMMS